MGSARTVGGFEQGLFVVVPGTLGVGKMHCALVLEPLRIHIRTSASRAGRALTVLLVTQWCDVASHGVTHPLSILLPAFVFGCHCEGGLEVAEAFVRVVVRGHGQKLDLMEVNGITSMRLRRKHSLGTVRAGHLSCDDHGTSPSGW
ncbi:hypothetical protein MAGR_49300 [Mycolicibacterium agri]|uniref:Uncharacterized protein n=1 Tax=Mycolicibacterium agri TaxID=36811 RepID=A0A7I9W7T6_MYCAG|nr:hypothetical protein MAGR_49300 [Mycolicibacterium agri]